MNEIPRAPSRRYFTKAALAAAVEAQRLKRENPVAKGLPEVFAVHLPALATTYGWEIRRFGSVVLERGVDHFDTAAKAREAGEAALATSQIDPAS